MKCDCIERVILRNKKKLFQFSRQNGTLILSENVCCKVVVEPFQFVLWKYICRLLREHVRLRIKSIVYYIANESIKFISFHEEKEKDQVYLLGFWIAFCSPWRKLLDPEKRYELKNYECSLVALTEYTCSMWFHFIW